MDHQEKERCIQLAEHMISAKATVRATAAVFGVSKSTVHKDITQRLAFRMVRPDEQDLIPLLDVETREGWTIKQLQDSVMKFAQLLEEYYGCKPMIYTSSSYAVLLF